MPPDLRDPNDDERFTVSRRSWLRRVAGVSIGAGTAAQLLHTTIARNGGDGLAVASGGSATTVNSIFAKNITGVRVNAGGVGSLSRTLWDGNTTDVVGNVNRTGDLFGTAAFGPDGYHITRYSMAREQSFPWLIGWSGLPSHLITRPSRLATSIPQPAGHSRQVVAK